MKTETLKAKNLQPGMWVANIGSIESLKITNQKVWFWVNGTRFAFTPSAKTIIIKR